MLLAVREFGRPGALISNSRVMDDMSHIGEIINKKTERVFRFNTFVPVYAMGSAVKVFLEQGGGNVINVASAGAMHTRAGAIYCGSKAAIAPASKKTAFMHTSRASAEALLLPAE